MVTFVPGDKDSLEVKRKWYNVNKWQDAIRLGPDLFNFTTKDQAAFFLSNVGKQPAEIKSNTFTLTFTDPASGESKNPYQEGSLGEFPLRLSSGAAKKSDWCPPEALQAWFIVGPYGDQGDFMEPRITQEGYFKQILSFTAVTQIGGASKAEEFTFDPTWKITAGETEPPNL